MTTQAPAPTVGQFIDADTELDLVSGIYYAVRLPADGSRRVIGRMGRAFVHTTWADTRERLLAFADGDPIVALGRAGPGNQLCMDNALLTAQGKTAGISRIRQGMALCHSPSQVPPNQIPHQRAFLNHCCTFAHEVAGTDFHPHASRRYAGLIHGT